MPSITLDIHGTLKDLSDAVPDFPKVLRDAEVSVTVAVNVPDRVGTAQLEALLALLGPRFPKFGFEGTRTEKLF